MHNHTKIEQQKRGKVTSKVEKNPHPNEVTSS